MCTLREPLGKLIFAEFDILERHILYYVLFLICRRRSRSGRSFCSLALGGNTKDTRPADWSSSPRANAFSRTPLRLGTRPLPPSQSAKSICERERSRLSSTLFDLQVRCVALSLELPPLLQIFSDFGEGPPHRPTRAGFLHNCMEDAASSMASPPAGLPLSSGQRRGYLVCWSTDLVLPPL